MMESLRCDFEFDSIDFNIENLNLQKNLLWILHADKIPPHIGISAEAHFFSLKVSGKDEYMPVFKLIDILNFKKISSVVIELDSCITEYELANKYKKFDRAEDLGSSCLIPIKELFFPDSKVNRLKDFLDILKEKKLINRVFGLNLTDTYKGISYYTIEEIEFRLEKLKHAKR
jgi:hypothetical protein